MAGQIISRGKGTWLVRVYLGLDTNGKRKYHNKTIHGNKKDAQLYLSKALLERDTIGFSEPSRDPLAAYLNRWLETIVKQRVTPKTRQGYEYLITGYLQPGLGNVKISALKPMDITEFYNMLLSKGLSANTVRHVHAVLRSALNQAVKWGLIYRNPADLVDLPKLQKREIQVLTPKQAEQFMEATVKSRWKALFSLLLSSGMRPGEALGLKWDDVDFAQCRVHVQRALSRTKYGWQLAEPKTARSRRTVPLPAGVMKDLREHKKDQAAARLKSTDYKHYDLVFANEAGDPADLHNLVRRHFKPLLASAGLPDITIYALRHTCATLLLALGENPKVVAERLGHASVTITLDTYSHVLPDMQQEATKKLEEILFNSSTQQHTKK